jgi:uncharacterized membrane protein
VDRSARPRGALLVSILLPIAIAIVASVFYATSNTLIRAGIRDSSSTIALFISLTVNVIVLWTVALTLYDIQFDLYAWRFFVIAGVFAPVLGRFFNYQGIDKIGINISIPLVYMNPVVAGVLSVLFLSERLTAPEAIGALVIVAGGTMVATVRSDEDAESPAQFPKRYLLLPLLGAVFYGTSHVFRDVGVDLVTNPILAAAVTTTTSWTLVAAYVAVSSQTNVRAINRDELYYFGAAGLATSTAIPLIYLAYSVGRVVIVTPVTNTSPLFVLLFSFVLFREEEVFSKRVIGGTGLIVAGVIVMALFGGA